MVECHISVSRFCDQYLAVLLELSYEISIVGLCVGDCKGHLRAFSRSLFAIRIVGVDVTLQLCTVEQAFHRSVVVVEEGVLGILATFATESSDVAALRPSVVVATHQNLLCERKCKLKLCSSGFDCCVTRRRRSIYSCVRLHTPRKR